MTVRVRFFAQFRELFGTDIVREQDGKISLLALIRGIAEGNPEGYDALFDERGEFRDLVILMKNGRRIESAGAKSIPVSDGDEIAVFPPVAGG